MESRIFSCLPVIDQERRQELTETTLAGGGSNGDLFLIVNALALMPNRRDRRTATLPRISPRPLRRFLQEAVR
jgi:hypothetical protein